MTPSTLIFSGLVFALVVAMSLAALSQFLPNPGRDRLARLTASRTGPTEGSSAWQQTQAHLLSALLWFGPWTVGLSGGEGSTPSALRLRFGHAGWRSPMALQFYFISKTLLTLLLPTLAWGVMETQAWATPSTWRMALVIVAAALGYYLPDVLLNWRIRRRQLALVHAFPDALDLLRLCVQAGLGLVSMLVQADRFGTSVSESLAVHAEALRTQRRLRAEEAGAKLPVKLLMPLIFCVFPSLLTVLLGPVAVTLVRGFVQTV